MRRPHLLAEAVELSRLPGVKIEMSGDERCRELYDAFTRRHARWRIIQANAWGVALLPLPDQFDSWFRDPKRAQLRVGVRRAGRAGLMFALVDPLPRLDEVLAIHDSAAARQGRPMHPDYLDPEAVRRNLERADEVFGILDTRGLLRAYVCVRTCGEITCVERILGHADALDQGVMWLLLMGVIEELVSRRRTAGGPAWFMYDMFSGASPGMRQFKRWIGCEPYRVSWSWRDQL